MVGEKTRGAPKVTGKTLPERGEKKPILFLKEVRPQKGTSKGDLVSRGEVLPKGGKKISSSVIGVRSIAKKLSIAGGKGWGESLRRKTPGRGDSKKEKRKEERSFFCYY